MARIRTIKPDFWRDDDLSEISAEAALLAIGLLNISDDEGYFKANPKLIEADIFPLRELSGTTTGMINELLDIGYIELFTGSDGKKYGVVINFLKHQVISKAKPSDIKGLRVNNDDSGTVPVLVPSGRGREGKGKGREKEEEKEEEKERKGSMSGKPDDDAVEILEHLNKTRESSYKPTQSNLKLITARLDEGHSKQELLDVIEMKNEEWTDSPRMEKYIRPATLFNAEKFNQYVGELERYHREKKGELDWLPDANVIEGEFNRG